MVVPSTDPEDGQGAAVGAEMGLQGGRSRRGVDELAERVDVKAMARGCQPGAQEGAAGVGHLGRRLCAVGGCVEGDDGSEPGHGGRLGQESRPAEVTECSPGAGVKRGLEGASLAAREGKRRVGQPIASVCRVAG